MDADVQELIGRQIAEFDLAAHYFRLKFTAQLLTAAVALAAVLFVDPPVSYWLSGLSAAFALAWAFFELKYRSIRACAERARRATLIMGGLGKKISASELNHIRECLSSSEAAGKKRENPDYFETKAEPGTVRLAEMLEESSYWTHDLQRTSSVFSWGIFGIVIIGVVATLFVLIPDAPNEQLMIAARLACVVVAFAVGTDMFGAALAYTNTVRTLDRLSLRIDTAKVEGYPEPDMLLMLSDYNAAVENTPLNLPFTYRLSKNRLTKNWERRQADQKAR